MFSCNKIFYYHFFFLHKYSIIINIWYLIFLQLKQNVYELQKYDVALKGPLISIDYETRKSFIEKIIGDALS
jgi:hypothetical protein